MNRERIAWMVSVVLIALLAFQLPGTMAQRDDDYSFVRTLVDIHRQVANHYVENVGDSDLRQGAIDGMLSELDPYSMYVPPAKQEEFDRMLEGSYKGVGIQLNQLENGNIEVVTPIDGSPAFEAGVQAGDIILKVNGESLEGLRLPDVIKKIAGELGSEVTLNVKHETGEEAELKMKRQEIVVPTVKGYGRNPDNTWDYYIADDPKIAYIRITQFTPETLDKLTAALAELLSEGMQGLILDLRFNPGGRLDQAVQIVDLFIEEGTIVSTKGRNRPENVQTATKPGTLPYFPMVVLVNEHSASASEIVAGSLKDNNRAVVIGERTYGKGSVQELIPLDSKGGELKLTVAYYYLPSGRLVHKKKDATDWGVQPHIAVAMDSAAQRKAMQERYEQELHRRPMKKATTQSSTQATTQPSAWVDPQLQRAVDTMIALAVLKTDRVGTPEPLPPTVTTKPAAFPKPQKDVKPEAPEKVNPDLEPMLPTTKPAATGPATQPMP